MAIKDWTPRTIRRIWLAAAVVQVAILLPNALRQYRGGRPTPLPRAADSAPGIFSSRDSAGRATLLATLRDSLGIILEVRGDTIAGVSLTPAGEARLRALAAHLRPVFASIDQADRGIVPFLVAVVLTAFSPTIAAATLTIYWIWARRRRTAVAVHADP